MDNRPIGVFDSGIGGLTVVKELIKQLPHEDIVYFGDTARLPYGTKSRHTIIKFSIENILFLLKHNVKLIIVACNTSSSVALPVLKRNFKVPIIGVIEPGARDALISTKNRRIGVIGTSATIKSRAYEKEIINKAKSMDSYVKTSKDIKIVSKSCPLFVPLVEESWHNEEVTLKIIKKYLAPIKANGIDTLILGCTHYPLLRPAIRKFMGKEIKLIDSAYSCAKMVNEFLLKRNLVSSRHCKGRHRFFVSDEPDRFKNLGDKFLGGSLRSVRKIRDGL